MQKDEIPVDIIHYTLMINYLGEKVEFEKKRNYQGKFNEMMSVFRQMELAKIVPDEKLFIQMMDSCNRSFFQLRSNIVRNGNLQLLNELLRLQSSLKIEKTSASYLPLIRLLYQQGNIVELLNVVKKMKEVPPLNKNDI